MTMAPLDRGCRLIHITGQATFDRDDTLPFTLTVNLRPPEFMQVAFILMCGGSEEVIVQGESMRAIAGFLRRNPLQEHPRFRWLELNGPNGYRLRRDQRKRIRWRAPDPSAEIQQ